MASYKLQILDAANNVNFNSRYERLDKETKPPIIAKAPNGNIVKEKTFMNGQPLPTGSTQRCWCDDAGTQYSKQELIFEYEGAPVSEIQQTKVFTVEGFQTVDCYTDRYCISAYYEIFPDDNGLKKDIDKQVAINANLRGMYQLWEHLRKTGMVARGVFCPSSRGFVESDGYIRAIKIEGKWGLEIGQFKMEKRFIHLQEGAPSATTAVPVNATPKARIRRI